MFEKINIQHNNRTPYQDVLIPYVSTQGSKRYRVVTLAGQLIDTAGTMSGGGGRVSKGRMSSKLVTDVSPQQLSNLEQRLRSDEKALQVKDPQWMVVTMTLCVQVIVWNEFASLFYSAK